MSQSKLLELAKNQSQDWFEESEKKRLARNKDLESQAKQLHELVATEKFMVNSAIGQDYAISFSIDSEWRCGSIPSTYGGGFRSILTLEVSPENKDIPIRTIIYNGRCEVRAGERIAAKIPKYEKKKEELRVGQDNGKTFYIDRDFKTEESAIELTILSKNGRTDRATDYDIYISKP